MKTEELLKAINGDLDQIQTLMKSYTEKCEKADPGMGEAPAPGGDMPPDQGEAPAGGEGDWNADSASNDELMAMLEQILSILEGRLGGGEQPADGQPAEGAPAPEGQPPEALAQAEGDEMPAPEGMEDPSMGEQPSMGEPEPGAEGMMDDSGMEPSAEEARETAGQELGEAVEVSPDELASEISQLSDEEFAKLQQAIQQAQSQRGGGAPAPAMGKSVHPFKKAVTPPPPASQPMAMSKAMPKIAGAKEVKGGSHNGTSEKAKHPLMKSLDSLCDSLEQLRVAQEPAGEPAQTYADANLRILEKSTNNSAPTMSGFELANWLLTEQRKGNRLVKSLHVAQANAASAESLAEVYHSLKAAGIEVK